MKIAASVLALSSLAAAVKNSISEGATVSFNGEDFATDDAAVATALEAKNDADGGDWYLNYYNFGLGFSENRQIFAYYPTTTLTGDETCVGIIQGLDAGAPTGANGGCDTVWGNSCSEAIIKAIEAGCSTTMFSGLSTSCGTLNVDVMNVTATSFTPASPAVWLTWNYNTNSSGDEVAARDLTYPVFTRSSDGTAGLACLRVDGAAGVVGTSMASFVLVAASAMYLLL